MRPHHRLDALRSGLFVKLLLAFVLVVAVAVTVLAVMSRESATREFTRFLREQRTQPPDDLIIQLADLYARQGNWEGAAQLLGQTNQQAWAQEKIPPMPLLLVDSQGYPVANSWDQYLTDQVAQDTSTGWRVQVDGKTVGTLLMEYRRWPEPGPAAGELGPEGLARVERLQRNILIAGLIAGAVGLVIAALLAWRLVRPLRQLTEAAEGIALGDLSQRVPAIGGDEVGELASTFNWMASELERAEQLRRNLTADIAHELRTPLSVIRGKLEGVLDGVYPATPQHLQPILESTALLSYLVEDLRLLAQVEAGQLTLEKRAVNIKGLLKDTQTYFKALASEGGLTLALDLAPELPDANADWHRLTQVLSNLLTNALRHTPSGGQVTLSATAGEGAVKVTVTDTGAGIPPEDLSHIFDRFWRGEKSRSRASGGSGLGLAIAKQLIELHGGTIGVQSTPGQGSTFWFTLPTS